MGYYFKSKVKVIGIRLLQALLFCIPLLVFMIAYKDTFFAEKNGGIGMTGLGLIALIVYMLCVLKIFNKMPKVLYFFIIAGVFYFMNYISDFMQQLSVAIVISGCISLPDVFNVIIDAINVDGKVDLQERAKRKAKERMAKEQQETEVEVEVN